ncbi:MAG: DUF3617 domain-containing protein [Caulobacteraceae bacterium]
MRTIVYAAAVLTLGVSAAGASARHAGAAEDGPILPGYWESTSTASFPLASSKTERKCITGRAINSYLTGPVNNHYSCRYDTRDLQAGHAHMTGQCVDSSGIHGKVVIDGDYAPEAFRLNGRVQIALGGLQIPVNTSIDAHRLSADCPAGVKVEDGGRSQDAKGDEPAPPSAGPPG